ncbi:MAG: NADH-quinone oxidoreductase subunit NuoE [candidate division KSB1 bacterium]|nr:NADH-quinone oxidoreductase subunit NuoE [candidate division KSB1 bacterium]MDZ7385042.1 NADH-quinone oxidoreductase subunit NuoE [candidate division KSB1 bacterium]MDZ7393351.1 NADH-quinone oxidoreductase subunit NuoE [candidate division KSB1 bacterium]MDZ7413348.1 NADH-quinone oxidoreductase subunit NuoE [candidate division KSB1 bacterium]
MEAAEDVFAGCVGGEGELIPILQRVQQKEGYISEKSVRQIARFLKVSENQVYGVASFYSQFRFVAPGRHSIRVCLGTACHVRGGQILLEAVQREVGVAPGQTSADGRFDLQRVACLGCCALAPVVQVDEDIHSRVTVLGLKEILRAYE